MIWVKDGILGIKTNMRVRFTIFLILGLMGNLISTAQDKSNRGREFWLAYGFDYSFFWETPVNNQELAIYISTQQAATVTVTITNTGYSQTLNIPANTADASILIPKSGPYDARTLTDGLQNKGIHIVSDVPVAVYAHVYSTMVSGATMLMPVETYGYSYYSINYYQTTSQSSPSDWYSWFYVIASEDNTRVNITPSDSTKNGWLPGQTYTINLNKGESYHVFGKAVFDGDPTHASKDMTGSKILSVAGADGNCHPVAVFSGSGGIRLCRGDGGEFVHQQVFPLQAWGTRYLTYHTINNTISDIHETNRNFYRICVKDPATVVKRNGVVLTGLINNFYYEYMDSTGGDYIEADRPILVAQYTPNKNQCWNYPTTSPAPPSYGDPEMFYLSPIEQGQKSVLFYTSRKSAIDYVYANIHLPASAVSSLRVDGVALPAANIITHPNYPSFSVALARFIGPAAQHTITCDSAFTATVYGLGNYESYGYNVGTLINNLNSYTEISNVYNSSGTIDTFTCPKTPLRLLVKVAYRLSQINWQLSQATGLMPNADSVIVNPVPVDSALINNRKYFFYSLQQDFIFNTPGTFTIPVSYTSPDIDACNNTERILFNIEVRSGPVADFSFTPASPCLSDSIHLAGMANGSGFTLNNYLWSFDDNTSINTINAVKKFTTAGIQHIRYRVFADNGCAGDTTKIITINDNPVAKFGAAATACLKDTVQFTDTSSISQGTISAWDWHFGDGQNVINNNANPVRHHYSTPGVYTAFLIVTSGNGCKSDTAFRNITIYDSPVAKFGYLSNICVGDSIYFSDSSSLTQGNITNWQWNFGDGNTLNATNNTSFYHPYIATGNYPVSLTIQSDHGCSSDTYQLTVSVNSRPSANFTITGKPCVDSIEHFISSFAYNSSIPANWYWDFGDGQIQNLTTSNTASHSYSSAINNISVKHVVSLGQGCASDTATVTIPFIEANPVAAFTINTDTLCTGKPVQFTSSAAGVSSWNWDFGNGTGNSVPPFVRTYSNAGNYTVSLAIKNTDGCGSAPVTQSIQINASPAINAGPDKFISLGSSTTLDASITNPSNYQFLWTPATFLNDAAILNPVSTPTDPVTYTITAIDRTTNCFGKDDVKITPVSKLYIPSAFTPNNDGLNDQWVIPGIALYPDALVTVYNRWGQVVLQTKNYYSHPWNGTFNGVAQPSGVFVYVIKVGNATNDIVKGTVTLIR